MKAVLEILAAVLAVFGGYTVLSMIKTRLRFPRTVRQKLRAAVFFEDIDSLCRCATYAAYLRSEQKISSERLIIFANDDIIKNSDAVSLLGEVCTYNKCKELSENAEFTTNGEGS